MVQFFLVSSSLVVISVGWDTARTSDPIIRSKAFKPAMCQWLLAFRELVFADGENDSSKQGVNALREQ